MINTLYYGVDELDEVIEHVYKLSPNDEQFSRIVMKLVCSFGKSSILTDYGVKLGEELFNRDDESTLTRNEIITTVFVMTELSILRNNVDNIKLKRFHNIMKTKYSPEDEYLKEYAQERLLQHGIVQKNPNYVPSIEQDFIKFLDVFDKVYK
jgi:hypothetical protein